MLKIKNYDFEIKSSMMNIKQRTYQGESFVSAEVIVEFFPAIYEDAIISGSVTITLDANNIKSLNDLANKEFSGDIGKVTLSISKDSTWEHKNLFKYNLKFGKKVGNKISLEMSGEDCIVECDTTIVSLFSTNVEKLSDVFDMSDFYDVYSEKTIGTSIIRKYIVKSN